MKTNLIKKSLFTAALSAGALLLLPACNSKEEEGDANKVVVENVYSVAVTKFALQADRQVLEGLDSVFFSIDLENKVIFNADSLPKGTDISKLRTSVSFYNAPSEAVYTMENGSHRTGTSDYRSLPNDTIDFTGDVTLKVVSADGTNSMNYRVKVNVHQTEPDSLAWTETSVSKLPSRMADPKAQKSLQRGENVYSFIAEADGSYTLSSTDNPAGDWEKKAVEISFTPDVRSFAASKSAFFMLDNSGNLYSSSDGLSWQGEGLKWRTIIGGYDDSVIGIREESGRLLHTSHPLIPGSPETDIEPGFPTEGFSNFITFSSKWSQMPTGFMAGGKTATGETISGVWAFDGYSWADISLTAPKAVTGASIVPYYISRTPSGLGSRKEFDAWMLIGGTLADGSLNRRVYFTFDNGVNWQEASELMSIPDFIPAMKDADAVVTTTRMSAGLRGWVKMPDTKIPAWYRVKYETDGDTITWECPYIYIIGGYDDAGNLFDTIWRGTVSRLTFAPLI